MAVNYDERSCIGAFVTSTACPHFQIQIWLAMAYDANRRHKESIALYKELENTHPMISIRRQAAEFRYIAEAPKLKISNDEVVTIPQIGSSWDCTLGHGVTRSKSKRTRKERWWPPRANRSRRRTSSATCSSCGRRASGRRAPGRSSPCGPC
ncbi:unnamed protein product [Triticum turgidum subsp. durum]|uniref:Uncharacterized protein n=1 Tax=Triticum turgidum subsp. durum TaxID=4567 RepID=A0A9R0TZJ3_TRITD|nr:unnamed protein product [Triticum turgidum subsp. durum]